MMKINPIIAKDLRIKMRGWRSPVLITVYLLFLSLVVFMSFFASRIFSPYNSYGFNPAAALSSYNALASFQFILLLMIVPALTGGIISGERERQTLDLLLCTNMSTFSIVTGKIVVAVAHVLLLLTASLPVMGTVFLYGGIRITDLLLLLAFYLATALMLGSMGALYSAIFRKSSVAMIFTYITLFVMMAGTAVAFSIWSSFYSRTHMSAPDIWHTMYFMFANPLFGFSSLVDGLGNGGGSILGGLFGISMYSAYGYRQTPFSTMSALKPWMVNMAFDIVVSGVFIVLGAVRLRASKRR